MKKSICIEKLFVDLPFYDRFPMVRKTGFDLCEFGSWAQHVSRRSNPYWKKTGFSWGVSLETRTTT